MKCLCSCRVLCFLLFYGIAPFGVFSVIRACFQRPGGPLRPEKGSKMTAPRAFESFPKGVQRKTRHFHENGAALRREHEFQAPGEANIACILQPTRPNSSCAIASSRSFASCMPRGAFWVPSAGIWDPPATHRKAINMFELVQQAFVQAFSVHFAKDFREA